MVCCVCAETGATAGGAGCAGAAAGACVFGCAAAAELKAKAARPIRSARMSWSPVGGDRSAGKFAIASVERRSAGARLPLLVRLPVDVDAVHLERRRQRRIFAHDIGTKALRNGNRRRIFLVDAVNDVIPPEMIEGPVDGGSGAFAG